MSHKSHIECFIFSSADVIYCEISHCQSGADEDTSLLGYYVMQVGK
jgi:hypothetical protein